MRIDEAVMKGVCSRFRGWSGRFRLLQAEAVGDDIAQERENTT